jgi:hypothetical protein
LEEVRHCEKIGHVVALLTARSRIPRVVRPQNLHAFGVELVDDHSHTRRAAGHGANQIKRVAVVDPEVRVRRPDQSLVDSTIALVQITEPFVNSVPRAIGPVSQRLVVEESVVWMHLRANVSRLRPFQRSVRQGFRGRVVVANRVRAFGPHALHL